MVERRTDTPLRQVRFPGMTRNFCPRVNFQYRVSYGVRTPPYAIACINICANGRDPTVHVRVRWIMETLKRPACTVGWVARLCRSWPCPGKATRISHNSSGTIQLYNNNKKIVKTLLLFDCKSNSCYKDSDCTTDVTFIRSIPVFHAENSVPTLFFSGRSYPQKGYQTHDLRS